MGLSASLLATAYGLVDAATALASPILASPLLPSHLHPGRRACTALEDLRDAPSGPYFVRGVLASRWRSRLLMKYLMQLSRAELRTFFEDRVSYEGASYAHVAFNNSRAVILAAPHFGVPPAGFLAALHRVGGLRTLNLYCDSQLMARRLARLFERGGVDATLMLNGFPGVLGGIRALARNEYLVMTPDVFEDLTFTQAVPFFGRMMRVAAGTAFFALRTNAWVVPLFAVPTRSLGLHVTFGRPIDPQRFSSLEESQAIFMLNRALFMALEREIRRAPEHWQCWETFPSISTSVEPPGRLEDDAPLRLLRDRCESAPHLLEDLPELELLVK